MRPQKIANLTGFQSSSSATFGSSLAWGAPKNDCHQPNKHAHGFPIARGPLLAASSSFDSLFEPVNQFVFA
jgi:hypothetical protein